MKHSRRGGGRHGNEGRADGASLRIDGHAAGGHSNEGRRNIEPLGLNVDSDREDGDQHLRRCSKALRLWSDAALRQHTPLSKQQSQ